jgi:hypothetical protein
MAISPNLLLETGMPLTMIGQPVGDRETSTFSSAFHARTRSNLAGSSALIPVMSWQRGRARNRTWLLVRN